MPAPDDAPDETDSHSAASEVRGPLFPPTTRLFLFCLLIGVVGALAALLFDSMVELGERWLMVGISGWKPPTAGTLNPLADFPPWAVRWRFPLITTLGGLLGGFLVYRWAPEAEGHGTDAAISAYHHGVEIRGRSPLIKAVASALTIGSGGVAGREGPTAQIVVGLGSVMSRFAKLRGEERRILLLASMAAGLAAIFRAPLGMAIFAVEILYAGMVFESEALIYTVVSAVTAYALHGLVVGWGPVFAIPSGLTFHQPEALLGFAFLGLAAGVLGAVIPAMFYRTQDWFRRLPIPPHVKPAIGGLAIGLLGMAFPAALGTGYGWVELALAGTLSVGMMLALLATKVPGMCLTIGSGGSGGVFGPTVVMGAMLGGAVGLGLDRLLPSMDLAPAAFVLVGMAAVFSGAARTPISTLIMTAEMTGGYGLIVPTMLANVLAFVVQRSLTRGAVYPTLYRSQVPAREDSPAHRGVFVRRALDLLEGGSVDPRDVSLPRLVSMLRYGEPVPVGHGSAVLVSLHVEPGSTMDGATVAEAIGPEKGASTVAVLREGDMIVPRGPTRFEPGDQVILMTTPGSHEELERMAAGPAG